MRALAREINSLNRQIAKRDARVKLLKQELMPMVKFGTTRTEGFRVIKAHVKGHHVQAYFCRAYDALYVERMP